MTTKIKHIVFDIGSVLIHYDPQLGFTDLIPDQTERNWFLQNICTHEWNLQQDRGRKWEDAENLLIEQFPDRENHIKGFRQNWHKMVPYAYDDSVAIFRQFIADGHDVTMLTNFASDTFREAQERFVFLKEPRGVTVSGDVFLMKPEREIYDLHIESFDLNPAETLFIDDNLPNIIAAREAGWQAVQFIDPATLRSDLNSYQFIT
ncbi:HAD family phosphatase [Paenochrobactrum glaciei]|uniref:HAD family phosphatase n=1 Tax=Paenochrobactrum glaciei TaxID=486407 RepID=A0ABP3QMC5_9HYPH